MPYGMQVPDDYDLPYTSSWTRAQWADEAALWDARCRHNTPNHNTQDCPICRKEKTA